MTLTTIIQICTIGGMVVSIIFFVAKIGELKGQTTSLAKKYLFPTRIEGFAK